MGNYCDISCIFGGIFSIPAMTQLVFFLPYEVMQKKWNGHISSVISINEEIVCVNATIRLATEQIQSGRAVSKRVL